MDLESTLIPDPARLFARRASRLNDLAEAGGALAGYLRLVGRVAENQSALISMIPETSQPELDGDRYRLSISRRSTDSTWLRVLRKLTERLTAEDGPAEAALGTIRAASDEKLTGWVDRLIAADYAELDPGVCPFLTAAVQVFWTVLASRLDQGAIRPGSDACVCPVCGSQPVASVLQPGGATQGLRFLCCSLCCTQWHRVRIDCVQCGSSKEVAYFALNRPDGAVKAEACAGCRTYLKLVDLEKYPQADPFADDLASLGLDILMVDEGYQRLGLNPFLIPGQCPEVDRGAPRR